MGPIGHPHWLHHPKFIWWGIQIMNPLSMYFSSVSCWSLSDRPEYLIQHPVLEHPQPLFVLPAVWETRFHTHMKQKAKLNVYGATKDCRSTGSSRSSKLFWSQEITFDVLLSFANTHSKFPKLTEESRRHVVILSCILFVGRQHAVTSFS